MDSFPQNVDTGQVDVVLDHTPLHQYDPSSVVVKEFVWSNTSGVL